MPDQALVGPNSIILALMAAALTVSIFSFTDIFRLKRRIAASG
jgi:hypothetical protein